MPCGPCSSPTARSRTRVDDQRRRVSLPVIRELPCHGRLLYTTERTLLEDHAGDLGVTEPDTMTRETPQPAPGPVGARSATAVPRR